MSVIVGVGVDLVHVPSFAGQLDQPGSRFAGNFTPGEQRDIADRGGHARHWAARWAAKEALIKAWSSSMYGEPPVMDEFAVAQIEVVSDAWGRPRLRLHGEIAKRLDGFSADVSLSHDGDYATAYVVLSAASR